jgi:hypothetical protein
MSDETKRRGQAIQQIMAYLFNEHGNVMRGELRNWVEAWLDAYDPPQPVEPTPSAERLPGEGLYAFPWKGDPTGTIWDADGYVVTNGLHPDTAAFIVRAVNASQRSEPVGQGGVARERVEDSDEE